MNFDVIKDLWGDILHFMDRVMGWMSYTLGGADDPYAYDYFWENFFDVNLWDRQSPSSN